MGRRGPKSVAEQLLTLPLRRARALDRAAPVLDPAAAPDHLSAEAKAWYRATLEEYELPDHQLQTLQAAAEAWDRYQQARLAIRDNGTTYCDDKGIFRARPEIAIERDSRVAFLRCLRELSLRDIPDPGAKR